MLDHLGKILAKKINKDSNMSKGMLLITIKNTKSGKKHGELNLADWKDVIKGSLTYLERIKVPNAEKVVDQMISHLTANQSLITMMGI
jgi:hypothetical protein